MPDDNITIKAIIHIEGIDFGQLTLDDCKKIIKENIDSNKVYFELISKGKVTGNNTIRK